MRRIMAVLMVCGIVLSGCATMGEKTKTGAIAGGVLGAAAGGIIGHQSGHGGEGAAIGAAVGALSGGVIGNQMDKQYYKNNEQHISIVEIADMAQKGVPDSVIISEVDRTDSKYKLTSEGITYLKNNGVSDKVIDYMLATVQ